MFVQSYSFLLQFSSPLKYLQSDPFLDPPRIVGSRGNRTEIKSKSNLIEAIVGETITVLRGVQLIVRCPVKGIPTPSIQWKRLNAYHNIDPRVSITADQSLRIHDVSSFDAGTYVCIATNKAGQDTAQVHVRVAGKFSLLTCACPQ